MSLVADHQPTQTYTIEELERQGLIELGRGNVISKRDIEKSPGNYPIYSSSVKNNGYFGEYGKYIFDEELISWSVDGGGNFFYRPKHKFSVTNVSGYLRILDQDRISYKYLAYQLNLLHLNHKFDYQFKAHPSVIRKLYKLQIPIMSTQKKVADTIEIVDNQLSNTARTILEVKQLKQGLMHNLFTKGIGHDEFRDSELGQIPDAWEVELLDKVSKRGSGHTPSKSKKEYYDGGIKWVSLTDTNSLNDGIICETDKNISQLGLDNSSAVLHPTGTVILSRDAGVGRAAILGEDMAVSQHFMAWTCGDKLNKWFLYYYLRSMQSEFERVAVGSTIKTIGLPYFREMLIPLPSFAEQQKIVDVLFAIDKKIEYNNSLMQLQRKLKAGLLQDLIPGRIKI